MHKLSTDSVVTFRKVIGSAEILPARPGIDPFEDTRPMSDLSCIQQSPLTEASPCVIARPRTQPGSVPPVSSYIFGLQSENFGHQPEHGSTLAHHTADPTSLHWFPYGIVVKIPAFHVGGPGLIPGVRLKDRRMLL